METNENPVVEVTQEPQEVENQEQEEGLDPKVQEAINAKVKEISDKQWSEYNKSLSKLGQENKRLKDQLSQPKQDATKPLLDMMRESLGADDPRVKSLERELWMEAWTNKRSQAESTIQSKIAEVGLDPEDEAFDSVWTEIKNAYRNDGDYTDAERMANRILTRKTKAQQSTKEEKPAKTKEEEFEEWLRQRQEASGQLVTAVGVNRGSGSSKRIYTQDEIGDRTFYEAHRDDILKAQQEGRIKV